jgi:protease-4
METHVTTTNPSLFRRIAGTVFRGLDRIRKVLHFILLVGGFVLLISALSPQQPVVPASAALILAPEGELVEQLSGDPLDRALARAQGIGVSETLVSDLVEAIRQARGDRRIKALVLNLEGLTGGGLSKLQDLAAELAAFRESGKPIIATGGAFDQRQYYLAAHADDIYMHPMGVVLLEGYSQYSPYFKSFFEKAYVDYHVWTVGEYKSFVEPITRDDMSPEDRESRAVYLGALWRDYQNDVTTARELETESLQRYADEFVELLRAAGGDTARLAADYGLIDELLTQDQMRERIRAIVGPSEAGDDSFSAIEHQDYLVALGLTQLPFAGGSKVAVVVAAGTILDGIQPPGTIGGESTAQLVRDAAADADVKALVLRVDSPGGSAFASELIRREVEVFRDSGRPVVVSMGSVAASGGYWISMSADEIWASPSTLTGSIGVGATLPTIPRLLDRFGVHVDGVGTTELAGQFDLTRELGPDVSAIIGESVRYTYDEFVSKVATSRERSVDEIDAVARGRVWVGRDALERGLVDELGDLDAAIESAAELAGLEKGEYDVDYFEPELGLAAQLLLELGSAMAPAGAAFGLKPAISPAFLDMLEAATEPLEFLARLNDPRDIYAYCFCDVR